MPSSAILRGQRPTFRSPSLRLLAAVEQTPSSANLRQFRAIVRMAPSSPSTGFRRKATMYVPHSSSPLSTRRQSLTQSHQIFEGYYAPPFYTDLYNFLDGAQNDIFEDSYPNGIPNPSPQQTLVPTPIFDSLFTFATDVPMLSVSVGSVSSSISVSSTVSRRPRLSEPRSEKAWRQLTRKLLEKMKVTR